MSDIFAVIVPQVNVNDESATIVEWNISSGTNVRKGDVIVTLETMKGIFEIEAEEDGTIEKVLIENGSPVEFDQPLFVLRSE